MKYKVLMVCIDDLCLSPLAAGLLNFAAEAKGFADHLEIDSAGTSWAKVGAAPDAKILSTAENHGFVLTHEARTLDLDDLNYFDEVLVMSEAALKEALAIAKTTALKQKIRLITEYDPRKEKAKDIADPRSVDGEDAYEELYEQLWYSCMGFLKRAC